MVTQEGYDKMVAELEYLRTTKRSEVSKRLQEAMDEGGDDLLENAELEAAKNEQSSVEGRIKDLEHDIAIAKIITEPADTSVVSVGSTVKIREMESDDTDIYKIVGAPEADPLKNLISNESPLGRAILGHKKGEVISVTAPAGSYKIKIVSISIK